MILVPLLNPKFATVLAAKSCELRVRGTRLRPGSQYDHDGAGEVVGSRTVAANEPEAHLAPQGAVPRYCRCNVERPTSSVARSEGDATVHGAAVLDREELGYLLERAADDNFYLTNRWSAGELDEFRLSSVRLKDQHRGTHLSSTQ